MLVRTLEQLEQMGRVRFPADASFRSARFFTADDAMGFSYNENRVRAGTELTVWLKHHWEANYIVSGRGEVTDLTDGRAFALEPGVVYVVGPNDRHQLRFTEDECHLSVFFPPLKGDERFDEDGSYEPSGPIPRTDRRMFLKRLAELRSAGLEAASEDGNVFTIPLLGEADGVGFGMLHKRLEPGGELQAALNHQGWQAGHVISGALQVSDPTSGATRELEAGMAFASAPEEDYRLCALEPAELVSVQSPAAAMPGASANSSGTDR